MSSSKTRAVCRTAILAALYVLLNMVSVRAGNLRITFASLPVVVCALLYGPGAGASVALLGEFLNQMLSYGFTATTVLWMAPPAVRGLVVGLAAAACLRLSSRPLEERPRLYFAALAAAAAATTVSNTAAMAVDGLLYHYFTWALVFGDLFVRLLTGLLTAAVVGVAAMPLTRLLRRRSAV